MSILRSVLGFFTGGGLTGMAATLLLGASLGGYAAWQVQGWRAGAQDAQRLEVARETHRQNEHTADQASTGFEKDRGKNELRTRTITVEVEKIVDRPVYRNVCLDADGLRLLNEQIRRADDTGQPGDQLPGPDAAG